MAQRPSLPPNLRLTRYAQTYRLRDWSEVRVHGEGPESNQLARLVHVLVRLNEQVLLGFTGWRAPATTPRALQKCLQSDHVVHFQHIGNEGNTKRFRSQGRAFRAMAFPLKKPLKEADTYPPPPSKAEPLDV